MRTKALATALLSFLTAASTTFAQATTNPAQPTSTPLAPTTPLAAPTAAQRGWWNDVVFYEVFVRSFNDSKTGPLAGDGIGDFQGLIDKLDYLKSLGVGALWLMPVTQSPSYHGYDTTDYRTIEKDYGTNDDFKRFMAECHKRNIKVVIDFVINHCSSAHPWFKAAADPKSDKHDWFIWADQKATWKGPWGEVVWHPNPDKSQHNFYYGMFNHDMPDLNYRNPQVTAEIHDTARFWLTEMGVDGFRLDAIRHLIEDGQVQENTPETHAWLKDFQAFCKQVKPDCFTVGEIWASTQSIAGYVNGREMDSAFEFELEGKLLEAVKTGKAAPLAKALNMSWIAFPPGMDSTFLTNHDQDRVMSALKGDVTKARTAATVLLTMPGIPFLYYGEEVGMTGNKPDPKIRTPMQWTANPANAGFTTAKPWQAPNVNTAQVNVEAQAKDDGSLLSHYKRMIALRNSSAALRTGRVQILEQTDPELLAFARNNGSEIVLIVVNLGGAPKSRASVVDAERLRCIDTSINLLTGLAEPDWRKKMIGPGEAWIAKMGCGPGDLPESPPAPSSPPSPPTFPSR